MYNGKFAAAEQSKIIGGVVECAALRKDGSEFSAELSIAVWQTKEGTFFTGIIRDITRRKQTEQVLQAYSDRLAEMVEERTQELAAQERLACQEKLAVLDQMAGSVAYELRTH